MAAQEKLQLLGSFGLEVIKSYPVATYRHGRRGTHLRTGDQRGVKAWRLRYENLPDDDQCLVEVADGVFLTPFKYVLYFFDSHHEPTVKPFSVTCPEDGQEYSAVFLEHERTMGWTELKMWTTGFLIGQWESEDGIGLENLSQANPDRI